MKKSVFLLRCAGGLGLAALAASISGLSDLPGFTNIADYRPSLTTSPFWRVTKAPVICYFYRENRFLISLDQMPKMLPRAFLAAEDAEFYEHEGVNPVAIFRAF